MIRIKKTSQTTTTSAQVVNTQSNSTTDTYSCDYENKYFGGVVLYNNTSGAVTDITLSDSLANYTKIDIYFSKNNDTQTVATIWSPNGKNATLYCYNLYSNTDMQELFKFISMSGTSITSSYGAYRNASSTDTYGLVSENQVKIYKVIGYK